jgi:GTP-binding protein
MIPADSEDIKKEYNILFHELETYNPELSDKQRILAITKCDMLDEEMIEQMKAEIPDGIDYVFISSVSGMGISKLKDLIWEEINSESNKIVDLVHRPMEILPVSDEEDEEDDENLPDEDDEDEDEDISQYKGIGWDDL